jgi:RNA polymerase sigma-70 factor (ECF subfamily)
MFSHMGLTASRSRGKEQAQTVIYNVAGQENGIGQESRPESGLHQKELGQTESGWKSGNNQGQNQQDTGHGGPFIIVGPPGWTTKQLQSRIQEKSGLKKVKLTQAKKVIASGMTEAEAIDRAKAGDAEAFSGLYGLHKRRVYSLCLRMTGNTAEAEDLTQEAFLQLYRKIATFRGESAFSTWLHRLAVNVVLMHLRKKGLPEVSLDEALEPQHEDGPKKDIGARDNVLAGSIDRVNLERAIESLPPGYRIIFVLHDVEGYEHNEIAEMMGCSIGNSKSQLHKARMKLRDLLKLSRAEKAARR